MAIDDNAHAWSEFLMTSSNSTSDKFEVAILTIVTTSNLGGVPSYGRLFGLGKGSCCMRFFMGANHGPDVTYLDSSTLLVSHQRTQMSAYNTVFPSSIIYKANLKSNLLFPD